MKKEERDLRCVFFTTVSLSLLPPPPFNFHVSTFETIGDVDYKLSNERIIISHVSLRRRKSSMIIVCASVVQFAVVCHLIYRVRYKRVVWTCRVCIYYVCTCTYIRGDRSEVTSKE